LIEFEYGCNGTIDVFAFFSVNQEKSLPPGPTLLFGPFKWKYTGKGLPEKAVKIMVNMINDFWDETPFRFWNDLNNRLNEKYETIKANILNAKSRASKRDERIESLDSLKLIINKKQKQLWKGRKNQIAKISCLIYGT